MSKTFLTGAAVRPYKLVSFNRYSVALRTEWFNTLDDLAYAAFRASWYLQDNASKWFVSETYAVEQLAFTPRGKPISLAELVAWGRRLAWHRHLSRRFSGYVRRCGPVEGIRKWRGGSSSRPCRVQNERRSNDCVLRDEGEVAARASRCGFHLPDSWDGRSRTVQRCWKAQHKGRKSWDRLA